MTDSCIAPTDTLQPVLILLSTFPDCNIQLSVPDIFISTALAILRCEYCGLCVVTQSGIHLLFVAADFLPGSLYDSGDVGDMFPRNVDFSPKYTKIRPRSRK